MLEDNEAKCCFTSSRITLNSIGLKAIVKSTPLLFDVWKFHLCLLNRRFVSHIRRLLVVVAWSLPILNGSCVKQNGQNPNDLSSGTHFMLLDSLIAD